MDSLQRTKIVATLGPASDKPETIRAMIRAGMRMARLNFSHGTPENHKLLASRVRSAARALKQSVEIIGDLQGPRVRVGKLALPISIRKGETVILGVVGRAPVARRAANAKIIPIDDPTLYKDLHRGDRIEIANGTIELRVMKISGHDIHAKVIRGGAITTGRGIATPGRSLTLPAITAKDKKDIALGVKIGVDYINVSFVKTSKDIDLARKLVRKAGGRGTKIMAKIETFEAVKNMSAILKVSDAIMIGRGDLAFAFPIEQLPIIQKDLIRAARQAGKSIIVATEMLASMVTNRRPTRAELTDVSNAVVDWADGVMLSEETAIGKHPVLVVQTMARIVRATEASRYDDEPPR